MVGYLGAPKVSVPGVERLLGEGKEQRQPFRIPGAKKLIEDERSFISTPCISSSTTEPAEFQGPQRGCDMISDLRT